MQTADEIQALGWHEPLHRPHNGVDIAPFDAHAASRADWSSFHAYRRARQQEAWPDNPIPSDEQFEEDERDRDPLGEHLRFVARAPSVIVGSAWSYLLNRDSPNFPERARFLDAHVAVLGPWRGRGIGTRLLAAVHALMQAQDKTILTVATHEPDGHGFMRHLGAAEKTRSVENRLSIDSVDWGRLAQWESAALAALPGAAFACFGPRVPLEMYDSLTPTFDALWEDIPFDQLEHPPIRFEMERLKEWYRQLDRIGGAHELMLLCDRDGCVVGLTEVAWISRTPDRAFQMLTGVRRDRRGLGLAQGLKAAMLRHIRARYPSVSLVVTYNAQSNAAMLAVNKKLGCRVYRQNGTYQIDRDAIGVWLGRHPRG
jgi:GNAT superfamily N-acetyltransferase